METKRATLRGNGNRPGLRQEAQRHAALGTQHRARKAVSPLSTLRSTATEDGCFATALQSFASLLLCVFAFIPSASFAATNDLTSALQKGLFEEEANHNLEAAAQAYQTVSAQFDKDRKLAATAIFRLGEVYRKQGRTNEAIAQYERVVREFSDQQTLATLSRQNLAGLGRPNETLVGTESELARLIAEQRREIASTVRELEQAEKLRKTEPKHLPFLLASKDQELRTLLQLQGEKTRRLAALNQSYTADHPEIKAAQAELAATSDSIDMLTNADMQALRNKLESQRHGLAELEKMAASQPIGGRSMQADALHDTNARVAAARNEVITLAAEFERLKGMNGPDLQIAVQQNYPNPVLTELMKQLSTAEQTLSGLRRDSAPEHPEVLKLAAQVETIQKQINQQVEGAVKALEFKLDTAKAVLAQLGQVSSPLTAVARLEQKRFLEEEIKLVEQDLAELKKQFTNGVVSGSEVRAKEREVLKLRQQVAALNVDETDVASDTSRPPVTDDEEKEIRRIQALIQNSPDLINAGQNPPIFPAVEAGYLRVVRFLLDQGADVNAQPLGTTPLHSAAKRGQKAMAELLLSRGANVNASVTSGNESSKGRTPLHEAAEEGFQAVVEVLLANKADVAVRDANGNTPLHLAVRRNRASVVAALAPKMPNINAENEYGITALGFAAAQGNLDSIKALLAAKAGVMAGQRDTPLLAAINHRKSVEVVELLLREGADPNAAGKFTPLGHAMGGSSTTATDTPLHLAAERGLPETVKQLLQFKADPNVLDAQSRTPLSRAGVNTNVVTLLLDAKADPNLGTTLSLLLLAVRADNAVLAELLLRAGANPNLETECDILNPSNPLPTPGVAFPGSPPPNTGATKRTFTRSGQWGKRTPLQVAVLEDHPAMVKLLLQFKGDPKAKSPDGYPLVANTLRDAEMLRAFLEAGADANASDWNRRSVLLSAAESGNVETVKLLLAHRAEVNARDAENHTPLHLAVAYGRKEATEVLLAKGADPNLRNKNDQTPLDFAKQGRVGVGEDFGALLRKHGARDDLPKLDRIEVRRPSAKYAASVFWRGTNDWNQFTLLELIAVEYGLLSTHSGGKGAPMQVRSDGQFLNPWGVENERKVRNSLPFPDFSRVVIRRPAADGQTREAMTVDLAAMLQSGECSKDIALHWGDVVEISEADHPINEQWPGFSAEVLNTIAKCLKRTISISVKDQTVPQTLALFFSIAEGRLHSLVSNRKFRLLPVLEESKLLRASSDLSRVKVTRHDPASGQPREWVVDCSDANKYPDLWLRDGDLIEVPDKP